MMGDLTDEARAWVEYWYEVGRQHREMMARIVAAFDTAGAHEADCDVCAHILTMVPRDVPDFLDAFDRAGPVLDHALITVGGIWSFPRRDFLWHERRHGE
jgi:hypothetical protein